MKRCVPPLLFLLTGSVIFFANLSSFSSGLSEVYMCGLLLMYADTKTFMSSCRPISILQTRRRQTFTVVADDELSDRRTKSGVSEISFFVFSA